MKKTKKVLSKIFSTGFFHVFSSTAFMKVASFAYSIVIVRIVSKSEYGIYTYAVNFYNFFILFSGLGLALSVLQLCCEFGEDKEKAQRIFNYSSIFALRFNVLLCLCIAAFSIFFDFSIDGSKELLLEMSLMPIPSIIFSLQQNKLRADLKNKAYSYMNMLASGLLYLLSGIGALLWGIWGIVVGHYLSYIVPVVINCFKNKVWFDFRNCMLEKTEKKSVFYVGTVSMFNSGMSQLMVIISTFLIGEFVKEEVAVAQYKVASMIPVALVFIPSSIMVWAYPYFARKKGNADWLLSMYKKLSLAVAGVNLIITIGGLLFSKWIIWLVFGQNYLPCETAFRVMMLYFFVTGSTNQISGNILLTQRKLITNFVIGIAGLAVSTGLNILLIPQYAEVGAAFSQLASAVVMGISSAVALLLCLKKGNYTNEKNDLIG